MDSLTVLLHFYVITIIPIATALSIRQRVAIRSDALKATIVELAGDVESPPQTEPDNYKLRFNNLARLYGNADMSLHFLKNAHVCIIGLGGVGSWCVEALSRSGIGKLTLVDMDDVCISNTNRQIQAATSTVGHMKGEALKRRILDINPEAQVTVALDFMRPNNVDQYILSSEDDAGNGGFNPSLPEDDIPDRKIGTPRFDFVVDAADGVSDKAAIIDACVRSGTPVVVCGGAGGLVDPTLFRITDMSHVTGDNLIMHVRKKLRQKYGYPKGSNMQGNKKPDKKWNIATVHTLPTGSRRGIPADGAAAAAAGGFRKCDMAFGNACFTTGTVGFMLASVVVNSIAVGDTATNIPRALGDVGSKRGSTPSEAARNLPLQRSIDEFIKTRSTGSTPDSKPGTSTTKPACSCGAPAAAGGGSGAAEEAAAGGDIVDSKAVLQAVINDSEEAGLPIEVAVVDSHCHLQLDPLYGDAIEAINAAKGAGITFAAVCGTCPGADWQKVESLWRNNPDFIRPQFGLHPWWISRYREAQGSSLTAVSVDGKQETKIDSSSGAVVIDEAIAAAGGGAEEVGSSESKKSSKKIKNTGDADDIDISQPWDAILEQLLTRISNAEVGECGLDKAIKKDVEMEVQEDVVRRHLAVARKLSRPVTLHCVGAWGRILDIIRQERASESSIPNPGIEGRIPAFVLHSANSMPVEMAKDFVAMPGVYFSFTARSLGPREVRLVRSVPVERILVETDSPDQLPVELKGKMARNEMFVARMSCVRLAKAKEMEPIAFAIATAENARNVFDI